MLERWKHVSLDPQSQQRPSAWAQLHHVSPACLRPTGCPKSLWSMLPAESDVRQGLDVGGLLKKEFMEEQE